MLFKIFATKLIRLMYCAFDMLDGAGGGGGVVCVCGGVYVEGNTAN